MLTCNSCGKEKPLDEFWFRPERNVYRNPCKECGNKKSEAARVNRKYGVTQEMYLSMIAKQGGGCAICGASESTGGRRLAIDHCHITGKVRGVLCEKCNFGLGHFADDPNLLKNAIAYLG